MAGTKPEGMSQKPRPHDPNISTLTMDAKHVTVTAPSDESGVLLSMFRSEGIQCELQERAIGDLDRIDFGKPSDRDRNRIEQVYNQWRQSGLSTATEATKTQQFTWERYAPENDRSPPLSSIFQETPVWLERQSLIRSAGFDPTAARIGTLLDPWKSDRCVHPKTAVIVFTGGNFRDGESFAISKEPIQY